MLSEVTTIVRDGLKGAAGTSGTGVHVKIGAGVAEGGPIAIVRGMTVKEVQGLLGLSPLADAVLVSLETGARKIYCYPVAATVAGTVGTVTHTGTGKGACTVTGAPTNRFAVQVEITGKGGLNAALLRYSLDGGNSWADPVTMPLGGKLELTGTGLTLTFVEAASGDSHFEIGDKFSFGCSAPTLQTQDVLAALQSLRTLRKEYEFVHLVGESDKAMWAALAAEMQTLAEEYHTPCFALAEAYAPTTGETAAQYAGRLVQDRAAVSSCDLQVCAHRCVYQRQDGLAAEINAASVAAGQYGLAGVQQSIGEVRSFAVPETAMRAARPAGIEAYLDKLDAAGYLTYRQYDGIEGWYCTNAAMLAPAGSNYRYAEDVRVRNKLVRNLRREALLQLQTGVDATDLAAEFARLAEFIRTPADQMVREGEISAVEVSIPTDQDLTADRLQIVVRYVQRGILRGITIDLGALGAAG